MEIEIRIGRWKSGLADEGPMREKARCFAGRNFFLVLVFAVCASLYRKNQRIIITEWS
jgi:hypothetical protein